MKSNNHLVFYTLLVLLEVAVSAVGTLLPMPYSFIVYILSFLPPLILGYRRFKKEREEREAVSGLRELTPNFFGITKKNALLSLPVAVISVGLVFLVSFLTSLLLRALNVGGAPVYEGDFTSLLIRGALIPAMFEELLFRYLPIILLAPYGKRSAVLLSASLFTLVHANLYQMPYALAAGLLFITADLLFDSILPSLIAHLLNNTVSVIWMFYINTEVRITVFAIVLAFLSLLSLCLAVLFRKEYARLFKKCFSE